MADFSFSFDSDNPFAEPEQAPKKATTSTDEPPAGTSPSDDVAPIAPVAAANAPDDDAFSLDSFDFDFDEEDSVDDALPTKNATLDETPPRQLTPGEAAFAEFDFNAPDSIEITEIEAPKTEALETEAPEVEMPEVEMPEIEAPVAEDSEMSVPEIEAPVAESPAAEELEMSVPDAEAPEVEMPEVEMPEVEASVAEDFNVEAPEIETSVAENFDVEASEVEISEVEAPVTQELETEAPAALSAPPTETFEAAVPDAESVQEDASAKTSARSARSDLEEFNAFTYDFGLPADETPADDQSVEMTSDVAPTSVAETSVEEPAEPREIVARDDADGVPSMNFGEGQSQTEAGFRRLKPKTTLKVAVLGASGIGKNHARWFHRHGCEIVGFLGTSPDSTEQTEADLSAEFEFAGNGYTDLETLLQTEKPDIVCVATPPPLHFSHVLQSLEAGAHVLCEKPLVYAPTRKFRENRDGAKELVKVAAKRKLNLGTQLQYGGATPILCKLAGLSPTDVGDFAMELETANPNAPRDPRELWIDLGPHPISVAQMLAGPQAQLAEETIVFEPYQDDEKTEVLARFGVNCADGRLLMVRAVVRALRGENPRKPRRRFSFNGHAVTYAPLQSVKNGFQAQFVAPDGYASVYPDPVDYLIGNFVSACRNGEAPMITGDFGRENLEWMLKVGMPDEAR